MIYFFFTDIAEFYLNWVKNVTVFFSNWRFSLIKLYFQLHMLIQASGFIIFIILTTYCLTLWGNNGLIFFTSRCLPVIIAHLDAFIWLNGIFWWLDQHGTVAAQFSSHLSDSISGAASWRRADWRVQTDSWKQMSWGTGEESRVHSEDPSGFVPSASITAPFSVPPPSRLIFFLPYCRLSWQYWTQFPWRKAEPEPLCHFIHWDDTVVKKKTILTPHLVGWNNETFLSVLLGVGCNTNTPQYPRQQLWYKR